MMPADYDQHQAEAQHLIHEADRLNFSQDLLQRQRQTQTQRQGQGQRQRHKF